MEEDVAPGRMASVRPVHFVIESGYRDLTNTLDRVVQGGGNASNFEYMIYVYSNCRVKPQGDAHNILSKPHGSRNISWVLFPCISQLFQDGLFFEGIIIFKLDSTILCHHKRKRYVRLLDNNPVFVFVLPFAEYHGVDTNKRILPFISTQRESINTRPLSLGEMKPSVAFRWLLNDLTRDRGNTATFTE